MISFAEPTAEEIEECLQCDKHYEVDTEHSVDVISLEYLLDLEREDSLRTMNFD